MSEITAENLKAAGYRSYNPCRDRSTRLYQKSFYAGEANLYAINFHEYDFRGLPFVGPEITYEPEAQLVRDGTTFNVTMLTTSRDSVADVEAFFRNVFWTLGCRPYEGELPPLVALASQAEHA